MRTVPFGFGTITMGLAHSEWSTGFKVPSLVNHADSNSVAFLKEK